MNDQQLDEQHKHEAAVRAADEKLAEALRERVRLGNPAALSALTAFATWVPGMFPFEKDVYGNDPAKDDLASAPLLSESYLYALFGKEEARTFLAYFGEICRALGVSSYHDLQEQFYKDLEAKEKAEKERCERTIANYEKAKANGHHFKRDERCEVCISGYGEERLKANGGDVNRCRHASLPGIAKRAQETLAELAKADA